MTGMHPKSPLSKGKPYHLFAPSTVAAASRLHGPKAGTKTTKGFCESGMGVGQVSG